MNNDMDITCPKCGSTNVMRLIQGSINSIASDGYINDELSAIMGFQWQCQSCWFSWGSLSSMEAALKRVNEDIKNEEEKYWQGATLCLSLKEAHDGQSDESKRIRDKLNKHIELTEDEAKWILLPDISSDSVPMAMDANKRVSNYYVLQLSRIRQNLVPEVDIETLERRYGPIHRLWQRWAAMSANEKAMVSNFKDLFLSGLKARMGLLPDEGIRHEIEETINIIRNTQYKYGIEEDVGADKDAKEEKNVEVVNEGEPNTEVHYIEEKPPGDGVIGEQDFEIHDEKLNISQSMGAIFVSIITFFVLFYIAAPFIEQFLNLIGSILIPERFGGGNEATNPSLLSQFIRGILTSGLSAAAAMWVSFSLLPEANNKIVAATFALFVLSWVGFIAYAGFSSGIYLGPMILVVVAGAPPLFVSYWIWRGDF